MRGWGIAAIAVVACGSGGPQWPGTYAGTLDLSGTCSDGSTATADPIQTSLSLGEYGLTVTIDAICSELATATATADGYAANLDPLTCSLTTTAGATVNATFRGTLTLASDALTIDLTSDASVDYAGGRGPAASSGPARSIGRSDPA